MQRNTFNNNNNNRSQMVRQPKRKRKKKKYIYIYIYIRNEGSLGGDETQRKRRDREEWSRERLNVVDQWDKGEIEKELWEVVG